MNLKTIIYTLIFALSAISASASDIVAKADSAYMNDEFIQATDLYLQAADSVGTSSDLLYNIGNSYYRQNKLGMAILYYERAIRLNPLNKDARTNLAFVNSKITDEPGDRGMFISNTVNGFAQKVPANYWSTIALVSFILLLGAIAMYIFSSSIPVRKTGFFGGFVLLAICILANIFADIATRYSTSHNEAIVIEPSTLLSTSPRVPKDRAEEAMLLHEGTKVEILDSVTTRIDSVTTRWYDVKVDNDHRAWIQGKDIAVI
ncbi:MAG: tetratricopeptide repeat protein [Muribaculum sp.]|nr:tetratricopeptide repeat protein [Muribaculum sp.]